MEYYQRIDGKKSSIAIIIGSPKARTYLHSCTGFGCISLNQIIYAYVSFLL